MGVSPFFFSNLTEAISDPLMFNALWGLNVEFRLIANFGKLSGLDNSAPNSRFSVSRLANK